MFAGEPLDRLSADLAAEPFHLANQYLVDDVLMGYAPVVAAVGREAIGAQLPLYHSTVCKTLQQPL